MSHLKWLVYNLRQVRAPDRHYDYYRVQSANTRRHLYFAVTITHERVTTIEVCSLKEV